MSNRLPFDPDSLADPFDTEGDDDEDVVQTCRTCRLERTCEVRKLAAQTFAFMGSGGDFQGGFGRMRLPVGLPAPCGGDFWEPAPVRLPMVHPLAQRLGLGSLAAPPPGVRSRGRRAAGDSHRLPGDDVSSTTHG